MSAKDGRLDPVVDDEDSTTGRCCAPCSVASTGAGSGDTETRALEVLVAEQVDLVLLDVMMPGMSGYDVCEKISSGRAGVPPCCW